jgi:hypothetical protein
MITTIDDPLAAGDTVATGINDLGRACAVLPAQLGPHLRVLLRCREKLLLL